MTEKEGIVIPVVPYFSVREDGEPFTQEQREAAAATDREPQEFEPDGQEKVQGVGIG